MAETKKRSGSTRASSSKRSGSTRASASKRSRSTKPKSTNARGRGSQGPSNNGSPGGGVEAVRDAVEDKAKSAGQTVGKAGHSVGRAATKAKLPLVAGGAALAGAGAGLALASRQGHRGGIGSALHKPKIKVKSRDVAKVAKGVGDFSSQVGALATELQRNREAAGNGNRRRSPIEVALQGLTSRH